MNLVAALAALAVLLVVASGASALNFRVEPHAEECFYEDVAPNTHIAVHFQVTHGGSLDIDVVVKDPKDVPVVEESRQSEGSYAFRASEAGTYTVCFSNKMSTVTAKSVSLAFLAGKESDTSEVAKVEHLTPLENSILDLSSSLTSIQEEQRYLKVREQLHRDAAESLFERVHWWAMFETIVLVALSVGQVFYIRKVVGGH